MGMGGCVLDVLQRRCAELCKNYSSSAVGFEVLPSRLLAQPDGLENGVDHGLERGPAIEWGHDESIHGRPGITVSAALLHGMVL